MNHNLAMAYGIAPSKPRSLVMAFSAPEAPDFLFDGRRPLHIICQSLMRTVSLSWRLSRNLVEAPIQMGVAEPLLDGSFVIAPDTASLLPGFYDVRVTARYTDTLQEAGITTFGWKCDEEPLFPVVPGDFDAYWARAMDRVAATALTLNVSHSFTLTGPEIGRYNVEYAMLPEHYDPDGERFDKVEVYKIDFASPVGGRVYAWFAKPAGDGPFPGMLVLPGAGNAARPSPVEHARHGYAAIDVQVHGYPVDLASYEPPYEAIYTTPDKDSHHHVYLNALQAVNALIALPSVDVSRLSTVGGSQGGRLSYVVPSLDPRIRATVPAIPHYCYRPWLRWTETQNEIGGNGMNGFTQADIIDDARTRTESYYDVINFVGKMRARLLTNAGLIDPVSPATGAYAAYRMAQSPKRMVAVPNFAHDWIPAFDRLAWRWLDEVWSSTS